VVKALHTALDGRRQRIVISESALGTVKWVGILLQGLCTLVAIAMVHSDNRLTCVVFGIERYYIQLLGARR
jgi:hypothetical protein